MLIHLCARRRADLPRVNLFLSFLVRVAAVALAPRVDFALAVLTEFDDANGAVPVRLVDVAHGVAELAHSGTVFSNLVGVAWGILASRCERVRHRRTFTARRGRGYVVLLYIRL